MNEKEISEKELNDLLAEKVMQWTKTDKYEFLGGEEEAWFVDGKFIKFADSFFCISMFSSRNNSPIFIDYIRIVFWII